MCFVLPLNLRFSMRPQHGLAFALLVIETDLMRFYADVLSWVIETSPRHLLKIYLVTAMNSYSQGLTPTAFIYSTSTCLIVLLLHSLRLRWHNKTLLTKTSELNDRDFIIRNIYKDLYWFSHVLELYAPKPTLLTLCMSFMFCNWLRLSTYY